MPDRFRDGRPDPERFGSLDPKQIEEINDLISAATEHHVKLQVGTLARVIRRTGDKTSRLLWAGALVAFVAGIVAAGIFLKLNSLAHSNQRGIRVSCLLLSDKLFQSGGSAAPKGFKLTEAALAQRRNSMILIGIVGRGATAEETRKLEANNEIIKKAGGPIVPPDCDDVATHPTRVERELRRAQRAR